MTVRFSPVYVFWLTLGLLGVPMFAQANSALNPASQSCLDAGGSLRMGGSGHSNRLFCKLPSGVVCERWALRRGECGSKVAHASSAIDNTFKPASLRTQ